MNIRDLIGGLVMLGFGLAGALEGHRLGTGTLTSMGSGFVPLALGVTLMVLGLLMSARAAVTTPDGRHLVMTAQWRGWGCIFLGVLSFLLVAPWIGLIPAAFSCVFVSALGDRSATLRGAAVLGVGVTVFGVLLFHYGLQVPIALWGH